MNNLGTCYYSGEGCDQNLKKAYQWYEKGAQLGNSAGEFFCGSQMIVLNTIYQKYLYICQILHI
mgnify:CR=1 FL=1